MTQRNGSEPGRLISGLSRRRFLQASGAAALVGVTGLQPLMAQTPKSGGRLRLGLAHGSTSDSLDPQLLNNGYLQDLAYGYANCLTEIGADGGLVPELAESYESSGDAMTWTFRLRPGVEFHNGKTLDSKDVVASLNYHRGADSKSEAKVLVDQIADISAPDANTVQVTLNAPNADFAFLMADHHLIILPAAEGGIDWSAGVGTGPYRLENFDPGVRTLGVRNANYWKEGRGHFDEVEWLTLLDSTARQNALITGEIDVMDQVPVITLHLLSRRGELQILDIVGTLHYTFPMWMDSAPFDNNHVRMALKLVVDRQELVDKILRGHGTLGNDQPISPVYRYYATDLEQRARDPDKAKWHVEQSGLGKLSVSLHASDAAFSGAVDAATLISEHAKAAGIEIKVVREPNDGYWSNVWQKKPWCISYWGGRPTEDWMFASAYESTASANETAFRNERFDAILVAARRELDEAKRRELYHEAQVLVRDECGALIPMFANHIHALRPNVRHPETVAGNWQLDGHRAAERWWFE
jgi:peptide/nickel transport system substrate-binding protein